MTATLAQHTFRSATRSRSATFGKTSIAATALQLAVVSLSVCVRVCLSPLLSQLLRECLRCAVAVAVEVSARCLHFFARRVLRIVVTDEAEEEEEEEEEEKQQNENNDSGVAALLMRLRLRSKFSYNLLLHSPLSPALILSICLFTPLFLTLFVTVLCSKNTV